MANKITEFNQTTSVTNDDMFVVSHQDMYVASKFNNESIDSVDLVDVLIQKVLYDGNLKSASYADTSSFSPVVHEHNDKYNKLELDFKYKYEDDPSHMLSVGHLFIDGTLVPVCVPQSLVTTTFNIPMSLVEPEVGSLKFVAYDGIVRENSGIDYKSSSFDGWLYPNGDTFQLADFSLSTTLNKLYGNSDEKTFTLPNLRKFIKANAKLSDSKALIQDVAAKTYLPKHTHDVNITCEGSIDMTLSVRIGKTASNTPSTDPYNMAHQGNAGFKGAIYTTSNGNKIKASSKILEVENMLSVDPDDQEKFIKNDTIATPDLVATVTAGITFDKTVGLKAYSYGNETYPSHVMLPVMIYVGKRR